jgi:hypothetical protein
MELENSQEKDAHLYQIEALHKEYSDQLAKAIPSNPDDVSKLINENGQLGRIDFNPRSKAQSTNA